MLIIAHFSKTVSISPEYNYCYKLNYAAYEFITELVVTSIKKYILPDCIISKNLNKQPCVVYYDLFVCFKNKEDSVYFEICDKLNSFSFNINEINNETNIYKN